MILFDNVMNNQYVIDINNNCEITSYKLFPSRLSQSKTIALWLGTILTIEKTPNPKQMGRKVTITISTEGYEKYKNVSQKR